MSLSTILITSILTNNILLTKFLGICTFMGTTDKEKNGRAMGLIVLCTTVISSFLTYLIYNYLLVKVDAIYLKTIVFILVIASLVQIIELIMKRFFSSIHKSLGIYLPLVSTNCAVFGTTLLVASNDYNILEALVFSLGSGIGYFLVTYTFAIIRERVNISNVPASFKGVPIAFITAAIMALLFSRYIGI